MRRSIGITSIVLLAMTLLPHPVLGQREQDLGEIVAGALTKIPVHVEEFHYEGVRLVRFPGGEAPEDILVRDLNYSDFFRVTRGPSRLGIASGTRRSTHGNRGRWLRRQRVCI